MIFFRRYKLKLYSSSGFTLVELLVALFCFGLLMTITGAIAVSITQSQRRVYASQSVQDEVRYIMEAMSKEVRMATIKDNYPDNLGVTNSNGIGVRYQFYSRGGHSFLCRSENIGNPDPPLVCDQSGNADLNSGKTDLSGNFSVMNLSQPNQRQPRITISVRAKSSDPKYVDFSIINLQITISSRDYQNTLAS